jgi:hypothetical protein
LRDAGGLEDKDGPIVVQSVNIPMTLRIENKAKLIGQA